MISSPFNYMTALPCKGSCWFSLIEEGDNLKCCIDFCHFSLCCLHCLAAFGLIALIQYFFFIGFPLQASFDVVNVIKQIMSVTLLAHTIAHQRLINAPFKSSSTFIFPYWFPQTNKKANISFTLMTGRNNMLFLHAHRSHLIGSSQNCLNRGKGLL